MTRLISLVSLLRQQHPINKAMTMTIVVTMSMTVTIPMMSITTMMVMIMMLMMIMMFSYCYDSLSPGGQQVGSSLGQLKYVSIGLLGCRGVDNSEVVGASEGEQGVSQQALGILTIGNIDIGRLV